MKTKKGYVYKKDGEYFTPAQTGDYYVTDMWKCNKSGNVKDIEENPCPVPVVTDGLKCVGKSANNYEYPEFNPKFF